MELEIISYHDLMNPANLKVYDRLNHALFKVGIVGISNVPGFMEKSQAFIKASREFSMLDENTKQQYAPHRDLGETEGYELGAEKFKDSKGNWQTDDKKSSFYAYVPNHVKNKWPNEVNLKVPYLELGELIFKTGKQVLNYIKLNESMGIHHSKLVGYGRMLHYHKENDTSNLNPNWCGAHYDHGIFTGLMPAYYFKDGKEVDEPEEAGLFIRPRDGSTFEKVRLTDKSVLLFQVGEFGQLALNDQIRATEHLVVKAKENIERFSFALFYSADANVSIHSSSELTKDARYSENVRQDGSIKYSDWEAASYARYRVI